MNKKEKITPCLWFNGNAAEAADLYCSVFSDAKIIARSPFVTELNVSGQNMTLLDGGPRYQPNPSISFYYVCETENELQRIWNGFKKEGNILMSLGKYPWSEKFGWISDKYGISWQLSLGHTAEARQKITPCLMFTGKQCGRAEEAMKFYTSVFRNSAIDELVKDEKDAKLVKHARFTLMGQEFMAMDSQERHPFGFSEGVSLTIHCQDQEEIDHYWNLFTDEGEESMCGWLKDKFGVSWQVVPTILDSIMKDPAKAGKAAQAFMSMKKLEIEQIIQATLQ